MVHERKTHSTTCSTIHTGTSSSPNKPKTIRDAIPAMVARIDNMFKSDPDGFKMLLVQLQNKLK